MLNLYAPREAWTFDQNRNVERMTEFLQASGAGEFLEATNVAVADKQQYVRIDLRIKKLDAPSTIPFLPEDTAKLF